MAMATSPGGRFRLPNDGVWVTLLGETRVPVITVLAAIGTTA